MAKNQEKKFGLAFDSGFISICDAPGKKSPIHLWLEASFHELMDNDYLIHCNKKIAEADIMKKIIPFKYRIRGYATAANNLT